MLKLAWCVLVVHVFLMAKLVDVTFFILAESRRKSFRHASDFDKEGILYYLGTNLNTSTWQNPADRGIVTVARSSSPTGLPTEQQTCILDLVPSDCQTGSDQSARWSIVVHISGLR